MTDTNTIEIPGYTYKVTCFGSYDEADVARNTAVEENEAVTSGAVTGHEGKLVVLLYTRYGDEYYL